VYSLVQEDGPWRRGGGEIKLAQVSSEKKERGSLPLWPRAKEKKRGVLKGRGVKEIGDAS